MDTSKPYFAIIAISTALDAGRGVTITDTHMPPPQTLPTYVTIGLPRRPEASMPISALCLTRVPIPLAMKSARGPLSPIYCEIAYKSPMLTFSDVFTCRCFFNYFKKTIPTIARGGTTPIHNKSTIDFDNSQIACRQCHGLLYPSQYQSSAERCQKARKLRQKIGGRARHCCHAYQTDPCECSSRPTTRTVTKCSHTNWRRCRACNNIAKTDTCRFSPTSTNWNKAGGCAQQLLPMERARRKDHLACITQGLFKPR